MGKELQKWAAERGYRVAWGSVDRVGAARADIAALGASGEIEERFYRAELAPMAENQFGDTERTVVMVAVPRPAHLVGFELDRGRVDLVMPPTYLRYRWLFEEVRQDLAAQVLVGARVKHFNWPLKATAARLGLIRYGRNNVTYAEGIGSYLQLCGYLTDAALPETEPLPGPQPLPECADCGACEAVCPTGAIDSDRFLLHAERCLTLANEQGGAWPPWVSSRMHTCLVGCLECQRSCPVNPKLEVAPSGITFSAEETRLLLDSDPAHHPHSETGIARKLAWLGQPGLIQVLGRNLHAVLNAKRPRQQD